MHKQRNGAALAFVLALVLIALQFLLDLQTGIAGVFIAGMAGGLLIGDRMASRQSASPRSPQLDPG